jgi:hypothetical protein
MFGLFAAMLRAGPARVLLGTGDGCDPDGDQEGEKKSGEPTMVHEGSWTR